VFLLYNYCITPYNNVNSIFLTLLPKPKKKQSFGGIPGQMGAVYFKAQDLSEVVTEGIFAQDEFTRGGGCFKM